MGGGICSQKPPLEMEIRIFPEPPNCPVIVLQCPLCSTRDPWPGQLASGSGSFKKGGVIFILLPTSPTLVSAEFLTIPQFWLLLFPYPSVSGPPWNSSACLLVLVPWPDSNNSYSHPCFLWLLLVGLTPDLTFALIFDLAEISGFQLPSIPRVPLSLLLTWNMGFRQVISVCVSLPKTLWIKHIRKRESMSCSEFCDRWSRVTPPIFQTCIFNFIHSLMPK